MPVISSISVPGVSAIMLLLLQTNDEIVRLVESVSEAVPLPPPRVTALMPSALVTAASIPPAVMTVDPEYVLLPVRMVVPEPS